MIAKRTFAIKRTITARGADCLLWKNPTATRMHQKPRARLPTMSNTRRSLTPPGNLSSNSAASSNALKPRTIGVRTRPIAGRTSQPPIEPYRVTPGAYFEDQGSKSGVNAGREPIGETPPLASVPVTESPWSLSLVARPRASRPAEEASGLWGDNGTDHAGTIAEAPQPGHFNCLPKSRFSARKPLPQLPQGKSIAISHPIKSRECPGSNQRRPSQSLRVCRRTAPFFLSAIFMPWLWGFRPFGLS